MKAYFSLLRIRFINSLQYRAAAIAGMATQLVWGAMYILLYRALNESNSGALPMELSALCSYVWMQQAFFLLFSTFVIENDLFDMVVSGNVAYELCRPVNLYFSWYTRSMATRLSRALLRCVPVLVVASLLPAPYGLSLPPSIPQFLLFLVSMVLTTLVVGGFVMLLYISAFYTVNAKGTRMILTSIAELFTGSLIPLPFFPDSLRRVVELLPFASMENAPLRIYTGDISGAYAVQTIYLQLFWAVVLIFGGWLWMKQALKNVVVQGG